MQEVEHKKQQGGDEPARARGSAPRDDRFSSNAPNSTSADTYGSARTMKRNACASGKKSGIPQRNWMPRKA